MSVSKPNLSLVVVTYGHDCLVGVPGGRLGFVWYIHRMSLPWTVVWGVRCPAYDKYRGGLRARKPENRRTKDMRQIKDKMLQGEHRECREIVCTHHSTRQNTNADLHEQLFVNRGTLQSFWSIQLSKAQSYKRKRKKTMGRVTDYIIWSHSAMLVRAQLTTTYMLGCLDALGLVDLQYSVDLDKFSLIFPFNPHSYTPATLPLSVPQSRWEPRLPAFAQTIYVGRF